MMNKISAAQAGQMMKMAAENLRALSEENKSLKDQRDEALQKVAGYERDKRVEKVAKAMQDKGINPDLSLEEKIAGLRSHEKLEVLEEAVNMSAPQMKIAHVVDGSTPPPSENDVDGEQAANIFNAALMSLE